MDEATHIIDPDGEVIIIFQIPDEPFAPWNHGETEAQVPEPNGLEINGNNYNTAEQPPPDDYYEPVEPPEPFTLQVELDDTHPNETPEEPEHREATMQNSESDKHEKECFRIQVSGKHLTLSSPVFSRTLTGGWKEGSLLDRKGPVEITTSHENLEAFLILMNIIHCQPQNLPQEVNLEQLAKLAVIADYYNCQALVKYFAKAWIGSLVKSFPETYSRDLMLWLWISWCFKLPEFEKSTSIAISQSKDVITNLNLPIPDEVIQNLNHRRESGISLIISRLHEKRDSLLTGDQGFSFEYSSIMLGALMKNLHINGLLSPIPETPFPGLCYDGLISAVYGFKSPEWDWSPSDWDESDEYYLSYFSKLAKEWTRNAPGLGLNDFH